MAASIVSSFHGWPRSAFSTAVARFGVSAGRGVATGGADINISRDQKGAIIDLSQDGTRYFDLHHTPDDTLDKIDRAVHPSGLGTAGIGKAS